MYGLERMNMVHNLATLEATMAKLYLIKETLGLVKVYRAYE